MDIHKPKAAHSWREFAIEIGTIVCGIVIALTLEQTVEWLHWRHEVAEGREHLREEIHFNSRVYQHRVDVAGCVQRNLADLKRVVSELRAGRRVAPIAEFTSPENGLILHEIWNSMNAGQVLVHFPREELQRYGHFYQGREDAEYFMDRESRAWRELHRLEGDPNTLSRPELNSLWVALNEAASMSAGVASASEEQLKVARALGVDVQKPDPHWRDECRPIVRS